MRNFFRKTLAFLYIKGYFFIKLFIFDQKYIKLFPLNLLGFQFLYLASVKFLSRSKVKKSDFKNYGWKIFSEVFESKDFRFLLDYIEKNKNQLTAINSFNDNPFTHTLTLYPTLKNSEFGMMLNTYFGAYSKIGLYLQEVYQISPDDFSRMIIYYGEDTVSTATFNKKTHDFQDSMHVDVPFSSPQGFLWINRVTKDNGATLYATGSSKFGPLRVFYEYISSIYEFFSRLISLGFQKIKLRVNFLTPIPPLLLGKIHHLEGDANNFMLFDGSGFHCRGSFQPDTIRQYLYVSYRNVVWPEFRMLP